MTPAPQDADARAAEIAKRWDHFRDSPTIRIAYHSWIAGGCRSIEDGAESAVHHTLKDDAIKEARADVAFLLAERTRLLALIPKPRPADLCTRCGLPIKGVLVGDVDGYAHQDCFYPPKQ